MFDILVILGLYTLITNKTMSNRLVKSQYLPKYREKQLFIVIIINKN